MKEVCIMLFILTMVGVGVYSKRKVRSSNDFLLGGRNMGGWVSAFAYGTSYFSAVIFIGYAGAQGWEFGVPITWIGISNAILGCFLAWKVLAKKTREMTQRLDASTIVSLMSLSWGVISGMFLGPYVFGIWWKRTTKIGACQ